MRRSVLAAVLASLVLTGCGSGDDSAAPEPSVPVSTAPSAEVAPAPTPVPVGKTFTWPDGLEATVTVLGELRPGSRTDLEGGTVEKARLAEARKAALDQSGEPMGLRVKLANTGDAPVDLDKMAVQWVGVEVGGMAQRAADDGAFEGELAPGESTTQLSAWYVPDIVTVGYRVLVWPQGEQKGQVGQFSGAVPNASVRPPEHGHGGHSGSPSEDHGSGGHSGH
ncbi:hypothetical protein V1L54_10320 [Streptomyces sp. TRM 70361]|uniref:hypothetical protein n=1 Tax=Streptomyces sp. TRM 70361 TaxID=3116553 RepID=UPI002E7B59B9|nr:hypothetical protein [Streptomyces sp. TRM 70361]MEE1939795.1 hypothetical protein [Streptomyces sp. TRM 70361]